jgi:hypothetical protein
MKYIDKTFPYPVLRARPSNIDAAILKNDDFPDPSSKFDVTFVLESTDTSGGVNRFELTPKAKIVNFDIAKMLESKIAVLAIEIRSPATMYRKVHKVLGSGVLSFENQELYGQVTVTPLVIMGTSGAYKPQKANSEFGTDPVYALEAGDILAIGDSTMFDLAFDFTIGDDSVEISPQDDLPDYEYQIDIDGPVIRVRVGSKLNAAIKGFESNEEGRSILYSTIYKDCVLIAIDKLREQLDDPQEQWAISLARKLDEIGANLTPDSQLPQMNVWAQQLLDSKGIRKVVINLGK